MDKSQIREEAILKKKVQKSLGKTLKEIRSNKKLSQSEIAWRCNFDRTSYHNIEAGRRNITIFTLYKIAYALNESVENLLKAVKKE